MYVPQLDLASGKVQLANIPDGIPLTKVSVAVGGGYIPVGTTPVVLATNNTTRRVSFVVEMNEALASLQPPLAAPLAFYVARLNDGSQSIESLANGMVAGPAAAPMISGTLIPGIGFQATLNANGTVTVDLQQSALVARSVKLRYWISDPDTQTDP